MIELVRRGRTPEELAREFEPSAQAIRNWVKQAALDAGQRTDGLTTEGRGVSAPARGRQLREERAIASADPSVFGNLAGPGRLRLAGEEALLDDGMDTPVAVHHLRDAVIHRHRHEGDRLILRETAGGHEEVAHLAEGVAHG
jgi:transposase